MRWCSISFSDIVPASSCSFARVSSSITRGLLAQLSRVSVAPVADDTFPSLTKAVVKLLLLLLLLLLPKVMMILRSDL